MKNADFCCFIIFAERMGLMDNEELYSVSSKKMKASKIRELMKYSSMPGIISFGGGSPDPDNFPFDDVKDIINKWDYKKSRVAMQYGTTGGYAPLVDLINTRMKINKRIDTSGDDIIVTTGGQQGLFLVSRVFLDPGDVVLVEEPTFIGAMAAFLSCGADLVSVKLEENGACPDDLESKIKSVRAQGKNIKFFYTIPNFQNPKGSTMSQEKRKAIYDIAAKYKVIILEDDPYGDLYYEGTPDDYMPIKSLGNKADIIYLGSFSKVLCPGFRLGWVLGPKNIVDKVGLAKQSVDACSSTFGQVIAHDYLEQGKIDNYLGIMRNVYSVKKSVMINAIKDKLGDLVKFTNPKGGFFIYIDLPEGISGEKLFNETIKDNVAFVTGEPFHIDPVEGDKHLRLSFSNSTEEQIVKGVGIIAEKIKKMMR